MSKKNFDKKNELYEQYLDAKVALFMESYCESIHVDTEAPKRNGLTFPEELDSRCQALIKKECARNRWNRFGKSVLAGLRYVAIVAISFLSLSSFLFITVEAFRTPIINYYIEQLDGRWEFGGTDGPVDEKNTDTIDATNPLAGLLPNGYTLATVEGDSLSKVNALYSNPEGHTIRFIGRPLNNSFELDSENARTSYLCEIQGCPTIVVTEDAVVRIACVDEDSSTIYMIIADNLDEDTAVSIAGDFLFRLKG